MEPKMNVNELRAAHSRAVDELNTDAILADAKLYAAKEAEVVDLEGQIDRATRAQARAAATARPVAGQAAAAAADEGESDVTLQTLVSQARSISRREMRPIVFDDCLSLARKGLGFTVDRSKHFRSFGEQLQAIFTHYATKGTQTDRAWSAPRPAPARSIRPVAASWCRWTSRPACSCSPTTWARSSAG
jgi:hypothetical protein